MASLDDGPFRTFQLVLHGGEQLPDGGGAVFRGGEILSGRLEINLRRPMVLHAVKLQVKGRACWLADEARKQGSVEKVYFDRDIVLLERPPGRAPGDFPWAADYLYALPFECPIPRGCPTSYEGAQAFVRYFCRVLLEEGVVGDGDKKNLTATKRSYSYKRPFTMLAAPPQRIDVGQPVAISETLAEPRSSLCCCCCKGKMTAEFSINKTCFMPGETVYASLRVNSKRQVIEGLTCQLVDRAVRNDSEAKTTERVLASTALDQTAVRGGGAAADHDLVICQLPPVAPSCLLPNPITEGFVNDMYRIDANMATAATGVTDTADPEQALAPLKKSPSSFYEGKFTETMRKRAGPPLFRVEYELRVRCGERLLAAVPITVAGVPPTRQPEDAVRPTELRRFALGAQDIAESDDAHLIQLQPLQFAPFYPVRGSDNSAPAATATNGR